LVASLVSEGEVVVTLVWETAGVSPGVYSLRAWAHPVEGETQVEDNEGTSGEIQVNSEPSPPLPPQWLSLLLIIVLLLFILFVILALLHRRRKRKGMSKSFNKAWEAWYTRSPVSD
jgi:hypothetical protein